MPDPRRRRPAWWPRLGTFLFLAGLLAIGGALYAPHFNGQRVARVEQRAQQTARVLLECAAALPQPLRFDAGQQAALREAAHARLRALGHPAAALPEPVAVDDPLPGFRFAGRHYCFLVAHTPQPDYPQPGSRPALPALEVLAWPDSLASPGHTAFFFASDAPPAYTRNLVAGWVGFADPPAPGAARPNADAQGSHDLGWYRSANDERWLLLREP
jgi:hypothetical protein